MAFRYREENSSMLCHIYSLIVDKAMMLRLEHTVDTSLPSSIHTLLFLFLSGGGGVTVMRSHYVQSPSNTYMLKVKEVS